MKKEQRIKNFQDKIWDFYKKNGRSFPWRKTTNPYEILVSEIMLQQTQTDRVVAFYENWLKRFPDFKTLAQATFSDIYPYWQGLGYNRRALNLQKTAQKVIDEFSGKLPKEIETLETLPGIGPYTARAVSIFSFNTPVTCIETNIRRVFIHEFFEQKKFVTDAEIIKLAERALPAGNARKWHWALMDYGAYLRTTLIPSKGGNPNRRSKNYTVQSKFEGSKRQIRGGILKILLKKPTTIASIAKTLKKEVNAVQTIATTLEVEGLIKRHKKGYCLN